MNRIILIGNGFDLAHGLKTSYKDFIDDFWKNKFEKIRNIEPVILENHCVVFADEDLKIAENLDIKTEPKNLKCNTIIELRKELHKFVSITFKNKFLEIISERLSLQNWVDIEKLYHESLLDCLKIQDKIDAAEKLNKEFESIKNYLVQYFQKVLDDADEKVLFNKNILGNILQNIYFKDCSETYLSKVIDFEYNKFVEILKINEVEQENSKLSDKEKKRLEKYKGRFSLKEIREMLLLPYSAESCFTVQPQSILFLNFNYTSTHQNYKEVDINRNRLHRDCEIDRYEINIHGELDNPNNPIIFGFGDEIGEDYKKIENLDDNVYLENIKSIRYLETDNYKKLLEYINSEEYQVFIFGHSCGLSDRTLLHTLFEHKNCVSIKPFYHKFVDENNVTKDNYSDIVKNISRCFDDKAIFRDKVVNKTFCVPFNSTK